MSLGNPSDLQHWLIALLVLLGAGLPLVLSDAGLADVAVFGSECNKV